MKVYIFGLGPSRMAIDPSVPREDTEYWGLPWDDGRGVHYDRCFEMHDFQALHMPMVRQADYFEKLRDMRTVYVQDHMQWLEAGETPNDTPFKTYPTHEVAEIVGDYFASSISYMLGFAVFLGNVDEIGLYGVDLHDGDAFSHERPNIEYLLGFARARGIEIEVSPTSAIFDRKTWQQLGKYKIRYPARYGWIA